MVKFLLMIALLAGVFWCGYYVGQQPPDTVKQTLKTFSEDMMGKALGVEKRELFVQQEFLEAKARIIQSKSELLDGEYRKAGRQLEEALLHLQQAIQNSSAQKWQFLMEGLMEKIKHMEESLASGKRVSQEKLNEAQRELDRLLEK